MLAIACGYHVFDWPPPKLRCTVVGPAEPRIPVLPRFSKLAWMRIVTPEVIFVSQMFTAAWKALRAAVVNPV